MSCFFRSKSSSLPTETNFCDFPLEEKSVVGVPTMERSLQNLKTIDLESPVESRQNQEEKVPALLK